MTKIIHPCDTNIDKKFFPVFCEIEYLNGNLSITGVIAPLKSGNAKGGCGQINMNFQHRNPLDNDKRYNPIPSNELRFTKGWTVSKWFDFLDAWKNYHLNDMRAICEHQRAMGWEYEDHHNKKTFEGEACPTCGYKIGSKWLKKEVPQEIVDFLFSLPDTDKKPNWI